MEAAIDSFVGVTVDGWTIEDISFRSGVEEGFLRDIVQGRVGIGRIPRAWTTDVEITSDNAFLPVTAIVVSNFTILI